MEYKKIRKYNGVFKSILLYRKMLFCNHNFISDTQITFLVCTKCGEEHMYKYDATAFRLRKIKILINKL